MTPAPNAYSLPTFTDNLQMKIRCRLQARPKKANVGEQQRANSTMTKRQKPIQPTYRHAASPGNKFVRDHKSAINRANAERAEKDYQKMKGLANIYTT